MKLFFSMSQEVNSSFLKIRGRFHEAAKSVLRLKGNTFVSIFCKQKAKSKDLASVDFTKQLSPSVIYVIGLNSKTGG